MADKRTAERGETLYRREQQINFISERTADRKLERREGVEGGRINIQPESRILGLSEYNTQHYCATCSALRRRRWYCYWFCTTNRSHWNIKLNKTQFQKSNNSTQSLRDVEKLGIRVSTTALKLWYMKNAVVSSRELMIDSTQYLCQPAASKPASRTTNKVALGR